MYQALYRKYRSQTFGQLVGQQVVATTLRQAVEQGKISHAYLFSGFFGSLDLALFLAISLFCSDLVGVLPMSDRSHDVL